MSHEIEILEDGSASFIANRVPGWHGLGTVYTGAERLDVATAMKTAHLDNWHVRLSESLVAIDPKTGDAIPTSEWALTMRDNPLDADAPAQPLGLVSAQYVPVQNEEAFAFGQALVDDENLEVETAGSLRQGRQTFMLFRVPKTVDVGGDVVYPYLHVNTSHDGSMAVTAGLTGVRIVCANTQSMALAQPTPRFRIPHYGDGVKGQIQAARDALGVAYAQLDTFEEEMRRWLDTPVTAPQFDKVVLRTFPEPKPGEDNPVAKALREANRESLRFLYEVAPTNATIHGTAWGAAQSIIEWQDWYRGRSAGKNRSRSQVSATADLFRRQAFQIVTKEVPALSL